MLTRGGNTYTAARPDVVTSPAGHVASIAGMYNSANLNCGWINDPGPAYVKLENGGTGAGLGDFFNVTEVPLEWWIEVDAACNPVWSKVAQPGTPYERDTVLFFFRTTYGGGAWKDGPLVRLGVYKTNGRIVLDIQNCIYE